MRSAVLVVLLFATGVAVADRVDNSKIRDPGEEKSDLDVTAKIRRALVDDHALSIDAHNVKISAANGVVTLRGPVKSRAERAHVADKAKALVGADHVKDELKVER